MKAITIKQPWASLIVEGVKDIENRTWSTKFRGRVLIHSSAQYDKRHRDMSLLFTSEQWKYMYDKKGNFMLNRCLFLSFPLTSIIGSVKIIDCVINNSSVWAQHAAFNWKHDKEGNIIKNVTYNWVLANPIMFPEPIQVKGRLSFWDYPNILAEPEEKDGELFCHCQLPVKEINQVTGGCGDYRCVYCGGKWYK